jgi:chromosome segregation ATPase
VKSQILSILNATGCLILTAVVIALWIHERSLNHSLENANARIFSAETALKTETQLADALERDITALKESIKATQESAVRTSLLLDEKEALTSSLQTEVTASREQMTVWQAALTERDNKLRELSTELANTRARLDTAVARLKAAAAPQQ